MKILTKPPSDVDLSKYLAPYTMKWFTKKYGKFTPAQEMAIPAIKEGKNVLISSPTGTGKTLAAFLALIDELFAMGEKGTLEEKIYVVYVSPLRALNNDMRKNLLIPLKEIRNTAEKDGIELPEIKVAVRTSDTTQSERARMLRHPPHILITTPESLAIAITAPKFRLKLSGVRWVIVDEIHELASSKRGAHLALTLERLEELVEGKIQRIGLSATISPLETVAQFLVGYESDGTPRDCLIVDARFLKSMEVKVLSPKVDIVKGTAEEINEAIYALLKKIIMKHRTTLIFTNTRSATERVVYKLKKALKNEGIADADDIEAHHSSLSRDVRLDVESRLKSGKLKAVVCVSGDTKVITDKGIMEIKGLDPKFRILAVDKFKSKFVKFNSPYKISYEDTGLLIKTSLGYEIKVTKEHKFLTIDENGNIGWVEARNLSIGDYVGVVRKIKVKTRDLRILDLLPNSAYLHLRKDCLDRIKGAIRLKYRSVKNFANKNGISYSYFIKQLNGVYPLSMRRLRNILQKIDLEINEADILRISSDKGKHKLPVRFTPRMARLLGFWISDGSWKNQTITLMSSDLGMLKRYGNLVKKEFSTKPTIAKQSQSVYVLSISFGPLLRIFKNLVGERKKSKTGKIPEILFTLPDEHRIQFISGYFDGDGFIEIKNGRVYSAGFVTSNKNFAEGIRNLLLQFGIVASIREKKYRPGELQYFRGRVIKKKGEVFTVAVLGGEYLRKFIELIDPWRKELKIIKKHNSEGHTNRDVIPNMGKKLRRIRKKLGISTYMLGKNLYNPEKVELGSRQISRRNMIKLLEYFLNKAIEAKDKLLIKEIRELLQLAKGDILFDKIKEIKEVYIDYAYGIIDSDVGNYIVNGFVSKNSSSSLELGIDIGYIDAVVLLSSPKSVTRLIQRVGRSGHSVSDVSKGFVIAVDRDDLIEDTVLAKLAMERKLDRINIPRKPLDILAQHIVGMSLEKKWRIKDAYNVVKRAFNYRDLKFDEFMCVMRFLAGRYSTTLERVSVYSKIWMDELEGVFGRKRSARMIYYLNSGAIPDEAKIRVLLDGRKYVGDLEEGFVEYLEPGDIFVLGGRTYQYVKSNGMKIIVRRADNQRPTVPSWFSEMLPLTYDSALEVGKFRKYVAELIKNKGINHAIKVVSKKYKIGKLAAQNIVNYVWEQLMYTGGIVPSNEEVAIEIWENPDLGGTDIIFHYLFGRRVNSALSRAYAAELSDLVGASVRITVTDNGFMLTLPRHVGVSESDIHDLISKVRSDNLRKILRKALRRSEVLKRRFRHVAERSFAILRNYKGYETNVNRRQLNSETLFRIAERIPGFPLVDEAYREVMEDHMDVINAEEVLRRIENGELKVTIFRSNYAPSPFAHNIVAQGYSDIVLMEDKRKLLIRLYETVMKKVRKGIEGEA